MVVVAARGKIRNSFTICILIDIIRVIKDKSMGVTRSAYVFFSPPMPPHVLMNFRGFAPGCGDSVADF